MPYSSISESHNALNLIVQLEFYNLRMCECLSNKWYLIQNHK